MLVLDVNRREFEELLEHFESRPDIWSNVHTDIWARYEGESVVMAVETQIMLSGPRVEVTWSHDTVGVAYIIWVMNHFTTRGVRQRLQSILPYIGPNMIGSIVDLFDGWSEPEDPDLALDERRVEKAKRMTTMHIVNVGSKPEMSPYLKKLLGRR